MATSNAAAGFVKVDNFLAHLGAAREFRDAHAKAHDKTLPRPKRNHFNAPCTAAAHRRTLPHPVCSAIPMSGIGAGLGPHLASGLGYAGLGIGAGIALSGVASAQSPMPTSMGPMRLDCSIAARL